MQRVFYKLATQTVLTFLLLICTFSPYATLIVQAQTNFPVNGTTPINNTPTVLTGGTGVNGPTTVGTVNSAPAAAAAAGATNNKGAACAISDPKTYDLCISNVVYVFTVGIGSGFAYAAAYFFDFAIQLSLNSSSFALSFISTGWTTARDLANMAFLFILLYIAFTIMFNAESAGTMSLLAGVVVVALLVNFSFFFSRVVIDAGNIVSIQFYNSIDAPPVAQGTGTLGSAGSVGAGVNNAASYVTGGNNKNTKDLTASIMGMLQLQNLFNSTSFTQFYENNKGGEGFLVVLLTLSFLYVAAGMIFWALTVTFVTIGIKFIMRIVVLWFLIIFSPFAFVAYAVPQFKKYFSQWLGLLISHAFYPVAFMFIFLILVNFTNQMGTCTQLVTGAMSQGCLIGDIFNSMPTGTQNSNTPFLATMGVAIANIAIRLGFVLAILYLGMKASESVSVMGGSFANKAGSWTGSKFIGAYAGVGRNTAGWGAYKVGQSNFMQKWAARDSVIGRNLWRGANRVSKASFDVRGIPGVPGKVALKDGYKGSFDTKVKNREAEAKLFKEPSDAQKEAYKTAKKKAEEVQKEKQDAENIRARAKAEADFDSLNRGARRDAQDSLETAQTNKEKSAQLLIDAEKKEKVLAEQLAEAEQDVKEAQLHMEDLEKQGKNGTPEMNSALASRMARETTRKTFESDHKVAKREVETHKTAVQTYDNQIKGLQNTQAEHIKKIQEDAKKLAKKIEVEKVKEVENIKRTYADSIEGKGPWAAAGNMSRLGIWIPAADSAAAAKIKKSKTNKEKAADLFKDMQKEEKEIEGGSEEKVEEKKDEPEKKDH